MAATVVGGAFLTSTLAVMFDRLASREVINFFRGRRHDEKLLKKLRLKLLGLNKVLNDAEDKQFTDRAVKEWLNELKDAVYHAEDLVDEIATAVLRSNAEAEYQSCPNQVQSLISYFTKLFDKEIESKLERMIDRLEDFTKDKDVLGLREVAGQHWSHRLPTTSLVVESCVYGREADREEIMKLLLSYGESSNGIDVIPIVGMGGVGKTTLAQLLYNDGRVVAHFDKKAWVCVSAVFDVLSITRTIVEAIRGPTSDAKDLNSLQVKLKESLGRKKFLIVLDDVWNENYEHWDALITPFRFGARGSKIIVTTRNESVASIMQTVPIHGLKELPEEDSWMLFSKHAFEKGDCNEHPNLEKIGKEIVKRCKGLPLAAKTLGGLLRFQRDFKNWNIILESAIWELSDEKSNILPALRLSYHYLPSHLKRCFAYCSIFTKDYKFKKDELILTWLAEGLLEKPKYKRTMGEEGNECFQELLSRSFFQRSNVEDFFVMHDLLHDLAQSVVGDFCYRLENSKPCGISENVRHFSYARGRSDCFDKFKVIKDAKCLRTFLQIDRRTYGKQCLSQKVLDEILSGLTRLRLLSLPGYQIEELPNSIGKLIHLRFLDLSYTRINKLHESVCTLYNLETLLLSNCPILTTLPAELVKLISLRHLDLSGTDLKQMPMHISRLKDLQQLTAFVVGKCSGSGINELKELHSLRGTISISGLQNVKSDNEAFEAKLREKKHLEKLTLEWGSSTAEDSVKISDVLEKLEPHTHLKHLQIKNYRGTKFPPWLGDQSFCKMESLRLENIEFCYFLPPLGQLPSLKELTIARMSNITNVGREFYGEIGSLSKPFACLETLRFEEMSEWVQWNQLDAGEFSRLQQLEVIKCPNLIGDLPKKVTSVVKLNVKKCLGLEASLERATCIREVVLDECKGVQFEMQGVSSVENLTIPSIANLKQLMVEKCLRLLSCLEGMMPWCPKLELPLSVEMSLCYTSLERLTLVGCESVKSLPLGLFPMLKYLRIDDCKNFETLVTPEEIELQYLTSLEDLIIYDCNDMVFFHAGGLHAPNLSSLSIQHCEKLKALPEQMHTLHPSLGNLILGYCPEIESFPEGGLPSKLSNLYISNCKKLVGGRRDWGLQTLPSLTQFSLVGESEDVLESFPEEGLLPSTVTKLCIESIRNLISLNNRGLQLLGSLKYMEISKCPQLQSLPEERLPCSLSALQIRDCPLLKPRCRGKEGEDWHKIAHIPVIMIDGEAVFDEVYLGPADPTVFN